ncbi:RidA family protein [Bradyrhizobium sp. BR 10261]|uniref:RidA family protein n=1 Tax=Bradyrhizobium sp. BR 10261 TaxID=2749992 RepID=UPI001C647BB6|nr:RidA family protein [Bradyrhizobium sp. BR 10261]MBW7966669.1 RidA family protein [Bradyrhizobium sp. BR 10261]
MKSSNPVGLASTTGYSQIIEASGNRIIFISGQTSINSAGDTIGIDDFPAQVSQVFQNLEVALREVGCNASNLAKMTVFLRDMNNLAAYREARNSFLQSVIPPAAPAITLVEVSRLYGADFLIEIEAIAIK